MKKERHVHVELRFFSLVIFSAISCNYAWAQGGEWTWMTGDSAINKNGVYGTMGTEAVGNKPGSRDGHLVWTDNSGNLWMFGGDGYANSGTWTSLNDLWKYNAATNNWTWIKGDSTRVGTKYCTYGTKGVAAATNKLGYRWHSACWVDASGNFMCFAGIGLTTTPYVSTDRTNDIWKYNPSTDQWTWIKGDTVSNKKGVYGTLGTAAAANNPGARHAPAHWIDASGNLWALGGNGYAASSTSNKNLNDLWKYDISSGNWTWIKGDSTQDKNGVYGTKGVPASTNNPGGRYAALCWKDNTGTFWLMGGIGRGSISGGATTGRLGDLWSYNTSTNEWTWVSGDSLVVSTNSYGTQCVSAASNNPGGRRYGASWIDNLYQHAWIFGGDGQPSTNYFDNLWVYTITGNQWVWLKGNSTTNNFGVYGTKGVSAATNNPGGRNHLSNYQWKDNDGNFYLFGGEGRSVASAGGASRLNDLWRFKPQGTCGALLPIELVSLECFTQNNYSIIEWRTASETNNDYFILERSVDGNNFEMVKQIKGSGTNGELKSYTATVNNTGADYYYRLKQVDFDGKYTYSNIFTCTQSEGSGNDKGEIIVFPNPSDGKTIYLKLKGLTGEEKVLVVLINVLGQTVFSKVTFTDINGSALEAIDEKQMLSPGVYMAIGYVRNEIYKQKIIIK
ncbi:MAG: T9SS type A sorting domain-containing protein [Bacteroidetes bacterium]|nr:T9SS type A sorting domain-containing protein [Bacteroidota bacterium]